jgi:hypothetical protein
MSKPNFIGTELPKPIRWVTDEQPCAPVEIQPGREVLIEVTGDLDGKSVTFEGGLTLADKMPFLGHTRNSPNLLTVPAVTYLRPITEAVGVTITVRSIK